MATSGQGRPHQWQGCCPENFLTLISRAPGAYMRKLLMLLIQAYRYMISPLLPARCRYLPTCSEYAAEAVGEYGARKGGWLALRRICRCHPWGASGYDPVPKSRCTAQCGRNYESRGNSGSEKYRHAASYSSPRQTVQ